MKKWKLKMKAGLTIDLGPNVFLIPSDHIISFLYSKCEAQVKCLSIQGQA